MRNKIRLLIIGLLFLGFIIPLNHTNAQASLYVDAKIGFDNKVKYDHAVPLTVTITNNGEKFSGDFVIDAMVSYGTGSALVYPITLEAGEKKTLEIELAGYSEDLNLEQPRKDYFHLFEGEMEKGKEIEYEGMHYVTPDFIDYEGKMVLAVTSDANRLKAVKQLGQFSAMTIVSRFVSPVEVPVNASLLEMVDAVFFDDGAFEKLTEEQQQAIYVWTQQGGIAILGSEVKNAGPYNALLPFSFGASTDQVTPEEMKNVADDGSFTQSFEIKAGKVNKESTIVSKTGGKVLAAKTSVGKGGLIQTAFPLGAQPLADMTGYGDLLSGITNFSTYSTEDATQPSSLGYGTGWTYENELFPSFKFSAGWVMALIALYIVLVGPVLYSLLKRVDKREHMWIYVPVVSLVFSLSFFLFGAKDRLKEPQIQQMALYEVQEDGSIAGSYTTAVLSNKRGDFTFSMDDSTTAVANTRGAILSPAPLYTQSYIKRTDAGQVLTLKDMDYWSVQSFSGRTKLDDIGKVTVDLTVSAGKLAGTITNQLPVDLQDVKILNGNQVHKIGNMKKGETIDVLLPIRGNSMLAPVNDYWESESFEETKNLQARKLQQLTSTTIDNAYAGRQPVLVGWSKRSILPVTYEGNHHISAISLFSVPFTPKTELTDKVTLTHSDFYVTIEAESSAEAYGYLEQNNIEEAYIGEGEYIASYTLPSAIDISSLQLHEMTGSYQQDNIKAAIYNQATGQYELLSTGKINVQNNISDYLVDSRKIEFKISRITQDDGMPVALPKILLKGVAVK